MILPIGDDNPKETTPYVHYGIMTVNIAVFVLFTMGFRRFEEARAFYGRWGLVPADFSVFKMFTSMYLHGSLAHIFGNMLFLWIVGDNVEDRMGHLGYFAFYHAAGVAACLAHVAFHVNSTMPVVGASGAISGMMGAYAVFFPRAKIKIWYWVWLFFTNVVYVSAKWAVGLWFLEQLVLRWLSGPQDVGVAYEAHIGGVIFGAASALVLGRTVLKAPDSVRRIVRPAGVHPGLRWVTEETSPRAAAPGVKVFDAEVVPVTPGELPHVDAAAGIADALTRGDLRTAYRYFTRATSGYRRVALDREVAMRLGEALVMSGSYGPAARVYEVVTHAYPESDDAPEAAFRLGTILSRAFSDYAQARTCLRQAQQSHRDVHRRSQAADELRRIDAYLRSTLLSSRFIGTAKVWVIRQTDEPVDVDAVSRLVSRHTGESSLDVAARLSASRGLVAVDLAAAPAQELADALQAMNVPVLRVSSSDVHRPQPAVGSRRVSVSRHGVRFHVAGHTVLKTWENGRLFSCGCIGQRIGGRRTVDLFFADEELPTHLRLREGEFVYDDAEASSEPPRPVGVAGFARLLTERAGRVPRNPGMHLVEFPCDDRAWDNLRFDSERAFDQYNLWFLQLSGPGRMPHGA